MMKNIFVCIMLGFLMPGFAAQQTIVAATPVVALMPVLLNNPDFFDFTAEQKKQIAQIGQETNQLREGLDQSIVDARVELREALMRYTTNKKLVQQLMQEVNTQEAQRLSLSIKCANGLRKVLSAEQWKILIELTQ